MLLFNSLLFLDFAFLASSTSISEVSSPLGTKVNFVPNPSSFTVDAASAYRDSLRKHDTLAHDENRRLQLQPRDSNTAIAPLQNVNNSRYLIPITIGEGSDAQEFQMLVDTGAFNVWVYSTLMPASEVPAQHAIWNPSSAADLNHNFSITYESGNVVTGVMYDDTFTLGGFTIGYQAIGAAASVNGPILHQRPDGNLGLGLGASQTSGDPSAIANFRNSGLQSTIFTCALTRSSEPGEGFFTLGYLDREVVGSQTPYYTDIVLVNGRNAGWAISSRTAKVGSTTISRPSNNAALIDTGTALILVDDDLLTAIYQPLQGFKNESLNGMWLFPSSIMEEDYPSISLPVGDFDVTLQPGDIAVQDLGNGYVIGAFQSRGNITLDIFGDVWLNNVYAIFDFNSQTPRFGVVRRAPNVTDTSISRNSSTSPTSSNHSGTTKHVGLEMRSLWVAFSVVLLYI